ncbi:putative gustatory receptor 59c [Drosophila willistoni]|uniref:putative gustatory receptor 59c n=1 Tax=Drosophila willistoni TaxID=7260 RepID=UPI001F082A66|nr:putative gustatory receptor 59c [Drosophila willistoni]
MISQIASRTLFPLELDKRIDAAIENLQLQLVCHPFKFTVLGLFNLDQSTAVLVANALMINAIFLIQYDIANNTTVKF